MIKFKNKKVENRFQFVHDKLKEISEDLAHFCEEAGEEFIITEAMTTNSEDSKLKRISDTHRTGRALDIRKLSPIDSQEMWDPVFKGEFLYYVNSRYKHYGAEVNGEKIIIREKSDHYHIQLNRSFTMPELVEDN